MSQDALEVMCVTYLLTHWLLALTLLMWPLWATIPLEDLNSDDDHDDHDNHDDHDDYDDHDDHDDLDDHFFNPKTFLTKKNIGTG